MEPSQEPRNKCEKLIRPLIKTMAHKDTPQEERDLILLLQQMHVRLTLLEGADPGRLSDTPFE